MKTSEQNYLDLLRDVLAHGSSKDDRTKTGVLSVFGRQIRFDLTKGFPLLTTKKVYVRSIIHELLWFLSGDTNLKYLLDHSVHIWDDWPYRRYSQSAHFKGENIEEFGEKIKKDATFAKMWGNLGPVYGKQWRDFGGVDQISWVVKEIIKTKQNPANPAGRRLIVSAWNPMEREEMEKAGLPPCHTLFQFSVSNGTLSCQLYQRSADLFLGVPFNIASYSILTHMIAHVAGLQVKDFVHVFGDAHIYKNHVEQVEEQLTRTPKKLPTLVLNSAVKNLFDFTFDDISIRDYHPHPAIRAPIAV